MAAGPPMRCGFMQMTMLKADERLDDLQREGCRIIQNPNLFCFGMDAVLLAAFAQEGLRKASRVLDLCSGNGVIPILMDARLRAFGKAGDRSCCSGEKEAVCRFWGIEINEDSVDMARRSAEYNRQSERIHFLHGDLKEASSLLPSSSFDLVTVNPPYMLAGHGLTGKNEALTAARHEVLCTLDDVVRACCQMVRPGGKVCMVHRPFRLADIFRSMDRCSLEPKRMRLVYPMADRESNMVLIEAVRGGRPRLKVEQPLVIYQQPGVYTEEVRALYG